MHPDEIKLLRQELKLPLSEFGKLFGVAPNTALRWENGQSQPHDMAVVAMHQLREKLDRYRASGQTEEALMKIGKIILFGGLAAYLIWLFSRDD